MSAVSRSVYQKVCEENKRLKEDIHTLVSPFHDVVYENTVDKWRKKFDAENSLYLMLKESAKNLLKDYKCTDCGHINKLMDNGKINVGFCKKCGHPVWNDVEIIKNEK